MREELVEQLRTAIKAQIELNDLLMKSLKDLERRTTRLERIYSEKSEDERRWD